MRLGKTLITCALFWATPIQAQFQDCTAFNAAAQRSRQHQGSLKILHFGDSHLATPGIQGAYGNFFQKAAGKGGPGFGLPWICPRSGMNCKSSPGWEKQKLKGLLSLSGGCLSTSRKGAWLRLELTAAHGFSQLKLHGLREPSAGRVLIRLDGQVLGEWDLRGDSGCSIFEKAFSRKAQVLELQCLDAAPVKLLGLSLFNDSGASYSPIAFNGAQASWLLGIPEGLFSAQMAAEDPDLVILAFGTNEANDPKFTQEGYRAWLDKLLSRIEKAAPRALLMLVGPPDGRLTRGPYHALSQIIACQGDLAHQRGALFIDQRQAMGGSGAIENWLLEGLAARDRVHLAPGGYRKLARHVMTHFAQATGQHQLWPVEEGAQAFGAEFQSEPLPSRIYRFRHADGRVIITDNPSTVPDPKSEWHCEGGK